MRLPRTTMPRPFRFLAPFLVTLAAGGLAGCGVATTADWRRCSFDVTEVAFQGLRENQAEWRVVVAAVNPGGKNLRLDGLHLWALTESEPGKTDTLARLRDPGRMVLASRDTTMMTFDVSMPHAAWSKALRRLRQTGRSDILITGDAVIPTWLGSRTVRNAVREKHTIDIAALLGGGDWLRGLFGR